MSDTPATPRARALFAAPVVIALALVAVALGSLVQEIGCNQKAHYALVRALADGTSVVDEYQPESCDLAYTDGHYYAAKAPGLAFATLPVYLALDAAGAVPENPRTAVWILGLFGALLPALVLGVLSIGLAERVARGTGPVVAAALLLGTLVLAFATLLFAHVLAAALIAGAFALLWRERPTLVLVGAAGLLVGLAATVEHPAGLVALPLGAYAWSQRRGRGVAAFLGGCAAGFAPVLAYNWWSFGSPAHFAVTDVITVAGDTGHDVVGGQDRGLFGAVAPSTHVLLELLASAKGLLTLSPVVAAGVAGLIVLARGRWRREALAALGAFALYVIWNSGLTTPFGGPFGGDSPGARYLVPALPLLAPGLAVAFRAAFLPTALLAGISVVFLALATSTEPMLGDFDTGRWWELAADGEFTHGVVPLLGGPAGVVGVLPFFLGVGAVSALAVATAPRGPTERRDRLPAAGVVGAWALLSTAAPPLLERGDTVAALAVVAGAAAVAYAGFRGAAVRRDLVGAARTAAEAPPRALVTGVVAVAVLLAWHGATSIDPADGYDGTAHVEYAEHLRSTGDIPEEEDTYEFASPPAFHWVSVQGQRLVDTIRGGVAEVTDGRSGAAGRLLWLGAVVAGAWLVIGPRRRVGLVLLAAAAGAALLELGSVASEETWRLGQAVSVGATGATVLLAWFLGREAWPRETLRPLAVSVATVANPLVLRLGAMFHPEPLHALLAVAALLLAVRAVRRGWPVPVAVLLGLLLGVAAMTRQTALVVIAALGLAVLIAGRARALSFAAVTAGVLLLVAGPWWLHQYDRYGNPIKSNLEREGYMLEEGQPASFYASLPLRELVTHPYRPSFENELLPMVHADIWSDWFGGQHDLWRNPGSAERLFVSTQSVLGLPASVLAVAALLAFGVPALRRLGRGAARPPDFLFATSFLLATLSWASFVITLVRFPQEGGDPVKASYMLYLVPVFALVLVRAGSELRRRRLSWRIAVDTWVVLYAASMAGYLATAW